MMNANQHNTHSSCETCTLKQNGLPLPSVAYGSEGI